MKRHIFIILIFALAVNAVCPQSTESPVLHMDIAVKALAGDLGRKLNSFGSQKAAVGQFVHRNSLTPLGQYWNNQLTEELTNVPNRSYTLLSAGVADFTISGEIVEVVDKIRVYTRIVRSESRSIEAAFHSDFEKNGPIISMLSSGDRSGSSAWVPMDAWEPDGMESPVPYEIGETEEAQTIERSIHDSNDNDFFLLVPANDGRLVMETTGDLDTYMEFYDAENQQKLADDDDSASGNNARIGKNVQAGHRYIAKVRGYGSSDTGNYGFRAYLRPSPVQDEYEPDDEHTQAKLIEIGKPQQHSFHDGDDVDWVKFQASEGRYIIRVRGVQSNHLDTYIELYDESLNLIDDDDDGGADYDSRLSLQLNGGLYYLKVACYDGDPDQPYIISIEKE